MSSQAPAVDEGAEPETEAHESFVEESRDEDQQEESLTEATIIDPRSGPEAEQRAYEEATLDVAQTAPGVSALPAAELAGDEAAAAPDWREPPELEPQDDEFSPFPVAEDDDPDRRRSPLLTILLIVVIVAAIAAAFWFFAPSEWKVRLGLAAAGASPLALVTTHMDRQRLASGQEMLNVTGRVINPTAKEQDVPPLRAQLRTRTGKLVYKWTIAPPARSLAPGGSASFNSTEVSVPPGGDELTITVGGTSA